MTARDERISRFRFGYPSCWDCRSHSVVHNDGRVLCRWYGVLQSHGTGIADGKLQAVSRGIVRESLRGVPESARVLMITIGLDNPMLHQFPTRDYSSLTDRYPPALLRPGSASIEASRETAESAMD